MPRSTGDVPSHPYRTHRCGDPRPEHIGSRIRLAGWVHRRRDHGNLLFVDLRDHYGVTQLVCERGAGAFEVVEGLAPESVISVEGPVVARSAENLNPALPTGAVEVAVELVDVLGAADALPLQVAGETLVGEEIRLRHRFLDLRRERLHENVVLRSQVITSIRRRLSDAGFLEIQTPILSASSPEGARDFLVPSRRHPGQFYALPQAPQIFKQLLMVAGFDRYFQIAPCFRDEDARADRSPGEFYQVDLEMSFATQDDVFAAIEPVLYGIFREFSDWDATEPPFPRIAWRDAMMRYGSDKPDLRNPIEMCDATDVFRGGGFRAFAGRIESGAVVRAIPAPGAGSRPRSFFDRLVEFARAEGAPGLAYVVFGAKATGPIARFVSRDDIAELSARAGVGEGDALFFLCDEPASAARLGRSVRTRLGELLELGCEDAYRFCWIVDYPMYERNAETGAIEFSHNPFSMPQGGLEALRGPDPLEVLAWQYDIVCNGVELSSGAIRNHRVDVMLEAFALAGYPAAVVEERFGALYRAFKFGAPPHGGLAPGIDRILMLLAREPNIREVIPFPMAQNAHDLLMNAPSEATPEQLRELGLRLDRA